MVREGGCSSPQPRRFELSDGWRRDQNSIGPKGAPAPPGDSVRAGPVRRGPIRPGPRPHPRRPRPHPPRPRPRPRRPRPPRSRPLRRLPCRPVSSRLKRRSPAPADLFLQTRSPIKGRDRFLWKTQYQSPPHSWRVRRSFRRSSRRCGQPRQRPQSPRPDRSPATVLPGHNSGSPTNYLESRPAGGEAVLSQPAPKPGQDPLPMSRAATAPPSANEGAEAVERFVEMAALQRQSSSTQMNILLRDSRLGRLSLRLVERAGFIDTIVRTDRGRTGNLINDTLPRLFESLADRGLQAQAAPSNGSAGYGDTHHQQQGGRRQQRSFRSRQPTGRQARSFQLEVERSV